MASTAKCFTFVWKLENISYCSQKREERLESPTFQVNEIKGVEWKLILYPRGVRNDSHIGYSIKMISSLSVNEVEIICELAFIKTDGSVFAKNGYFKQVFRQGQERGLSSFQNRDDVFNSKKTEFLSEDTLIMRCRIWKSTVQLSENVQCTALTRIGVERRSFIWEVKNFSTLKRGEIRTAEVNSLNNFTTTVNKVSLQLSNIYGAEETITFNLDLWNRTGYFTFRLFVLDALQNKLECYKTEDWFINLYSTKNCSFSFKKKDLMQRESMYLPDDTLSFLVELHFSKGVVSEEIVEVLNGFACPESKITDFSNSNDEKILTSDALINNVKSLYDEHFLSDVKLKTSTCVFPANKFILSAASSVFKAMFSRDMKENINNCVNIEDLSDDTVRRMLHFIYSTRVDDLTWESAYHLYVAADKYAILNLKNVCSSFLKKSLTPSNVCHILVLSDFHSDHDFKSAVQYYILKNAKLIINSAEWNALIQTHPKVAAETLAQLYK